MSRRRWQRTDGLQTHALGRDWVVFHPGVGATHLLTPAAATLMDCLPPGETVDEAQLARCLGAPPAAPDTDLDYWLARLQAAELIREQH